MHITLAKDSPKEKRFEIFFRHFYPKGDPYRFSKMSDEQILKDIIKNYTKCSETDLDTTEKSIYEIFSKKLSIFGLRKPEEIKRIFNPKKMLELRQKGSWILFTKNPMTSCTIKVDTKESTYYISGEKIFDTHENFCKRTGRLKSFGKALTETYSVDIPESENRLISKEDSGIIWRLYLEMTNDLVNKEIEFIKRYLKKRNKKDKKDQESKPVITPTKIPTKIQDFYLQTK